MASPDAVQEAVALYTEALRQHAAGRGRDALEACSTALSMLEAELGAASADVANVLCLMGRLHEDLAEYSDAEAAYRRADGILEQLGGDEDLMVRLRVQALGGVAGVCRTQGRLEEAEALFGEALEVARAARVNATRAYVTQCVAWILPLFQRRVANLDSRPLLRADPLPHFTACWRQPRRAPSNRPYRLVSPSESGQTLSSSVANNDS